jgi:pSer/pThr/pTyr-binding forkhead associated (FHA) protein
VPQDGPATQPSAPSQARAATAPIDATAAVATAMAIAPQPAHSTTPVAAAPRPRARLVLIARDGGEGPSYPVGETTDIGRVEGNIVISDDRYISPRHARISLRSGGFFLRDLESVNGVFVRIPFEGGARTASGESRAALAGAGANARSSAFDAARDPNLEITRNTSATANGEANGPIQAESEQLLTDQELFLVGQQVLRFEVVKHAEEGFGVASENGTLLFGTPAAPRYARLSQRTVEGVVRDVFHVRKAETVIGRESGDIVFTDDPFLSRRHAVVRAYGSLSPDAPRRFVIADLGSSNGTFLQVRNEVRLRHGDQFRIGQQLFRFDLDAARAGA